MIKEIHINDIVSVMNIAFGKELESIRACIFDAKKANNHDAVKSGEAFVLGMQRAQDMMFAALQSFNSIG
jgi:hypothetical protein